MAAKCRPQKLPEKYNRLRVCNCPRTIHPQKLFHDNTHDIAQTLVQILILSGIHSCKAKGAKDIILNAFSHYDEVHHGENNKTPPKKLCKESVIRCLAEKCLMTHFEAEFTHATMKQILKAYFQKVPKHSIRNYIMESQEIYDQKSAWCHAARRISQIFTSFEYVLAPAVKNYRSEIKYIFEELYNRMVHRVDPIELPVHTCVGPTTYIIERAAIQEKDEEILETESSCSVLPKPCNLNCFNVQSKQKKKVLKVGRTNKCPKDAIENNRHPFECFPRCLKCNCPRQICICNIDPRTGKVCFDSSQEPFRCEWYRLDKEYRVKPRDHICPIDCWGITSSFGDSDDEGEYESIYDSSSDMSVCKSEDSTSEIDKYPETHIENICVEELQSSSEECEPIMEGNTYCCHIPVCNMEPILFKDKFICRPDPKENAVIQTFEEKQLLPPASRKKIVSLEEDADKSPSNEKPDDQGQVDGLDEKSQESSTHEHKTPSDEKRGDQDQGEKDTDDQKSGDGSLDGLDGKSQESSTHGDKTPSGENLSDEDQVDQTQGENDSDGVKSGDQDLDDLDEESQESSTHGDKTPSDEKIDDQGEKDQGSDGEKLDDKEPGGSGSGIQVPKDPSTTSIRRSVAEISINQGSDSKNYGCKNPCEEKPILKNKPSGSKKKRLPCCKCRAKKQAPKIITCKCVKCKEVKLMKNRIVSATSIC